MKHNITPFLCGLALLGAAASAQAAALPWDWSWTGDSYTLAGTLTTDAAALDGSYQITAATLTSYIIEGAPSGLTLSSLYPGYEGADNVILSSNPTQKQLDGDGFAFSLSDSSLWNIYRFSYEGNNFDYFITGAPYGGDQGLFTANLSAVPEPSEWAAICFGVLGLACVAKRRLTKAAH